MQEQVKLYNQAHPTPPIHSPHIQAASNKHVRERHTLGEKHSLWEPRRSSPG